MANDRILTVDTMRENAMRRPQRLWTLALAATMALMPALAQEPAEQQVMELTNADRAQHGLAPLKWDPRSPRQQPNTRS